MGKIFRQCLFAYINQLVDDIWSYVTKEIVRIPTENFTKAGSLTNGPVYTRFNNSDYINIPLSQSYGSGTISSFEIRVKCKTPVNWKSNGRLLNSSNAYDNPSMDFNTGGLGWNYCGTYYRILDSSMIKSDTIYYIKMAYADNRLIMSYSFDGDTYTTTYSYAVSSGSIYLTTPVFNVGCRKYDNNSSCIWNGAVYINGYYIKVNDDILFDGSTAVAGTDYIVNGNLNYVSSPNTYTNFSQSNYITVPVNFSDATSFQFILKAHTATSYSRENALLQHNADCKGIVFRMNSAGNIHLWLSSNGTSWNVKDNWFPGFNIPTNTDVWFSLKWDGSTYTVGYSTDGTTYTEASFSSTEKLYFTDIQAIGCYSNENIGWEGNIYIDQCQIKKNNEVMWEYLKYPLIVGDEIKINDGMGFADYDWNAYTKNTDVTGPFTLSSTIKEIATDELGQLKYKIAKPVIETNNATINTGEGYKCLSDGTVADDLFLKKTDVITTTDDYRVTNTGCAKGPGWSNFSSTNNIRTVTTFTPANYNTWEWLFKFTYTPNPSKSQVIYSEGASYESRVDVAERGVLRLCLSASGSSCSIGTQEGSTVLTSGEAYYVKVEFTGSHYYVYLSKDKQTWSKEIDIVSSAKLANRGTWAIGVNLLNGYNYEFKGAIDISESYIKGDDNYIFNGAVTSDYTIVGSLTYLPNTSTYSGGSNKYLVLNTMPTFATANSWEFKFKTTYNGGGSYPAICGSSDNNYYNNLHVHFMDGVLKIWLPRTNSWIREGGATTLPATIGATYYVKIRFTGTQYNVWWSTVGWEDTGTTDLIITSSEKINCTNPLSLLNIYCNTTAYCYNGSIDIYESSITLDGVEYPLGYTTCTNTLYEKQSATSVAPVSGLNVKINQDNAFKINDTMYNYDSTRDLLIPIDTDISSTSTDDKSSVIVDVNQNSLDTFDTEASGVTGRFTCIDSTYHKLDIEPLSGYSNHVYINNKEYQIYELPCFVKSSYPINITLTKTDDNQIYGKTIYTTTDLQLKKQSIVFNVNVASNFVIKVNGVKWTFNNVSTCSVDAYKEDTIEWSVENADYIPQNGVFTVSSVYMPNNPDNVRTITLVRVYKYTFNVSPSTDVKYNLVGTNIYKKQDNWVQVYSGSNLTYSIEKDGYVTVKNTVTNIVADNTVNITLVAISENNVTTAYDTININNKDNKVVLYSNSEDHLIASAENTTPATSVYPYLYNDVVLPLDTAKSWEIQTRYRYLGNSTYGIVLGSSKDSWTYGGLNFFVNSGVFKVDLSIMSDTHQIAGASTGISATSGYEYKFKIGQVIADNGWTATSDGSNPILTADGNLGGTTCACAASHESNAAWYAFDGNVTTRENCWWTNHGVTSENNPCWITYYTPNAIVPTSIVLMNELATPESGKTGVFQASNDNSTWTDLAQINVPNNNTGLRTTVSVSTSTAYKYFRFYFTASWGSGGVSFQELFIYGFPINYSFGGTNSTFYVDYIRSERNTTENVELSQNGSLGTGYTCQSSDNNSGAWNAFNSNNNSWENTTQVPSVQNPIWLTYYTPIAVKPTSFTVTNDATLNNMKNGVIQGSMDNATWTDLYTITNRPQAKNLTERYFVNTENKYRYFRLVITERYSTYTTADNHEYFIEKNNNLTPTLVNDFFTKCLYGDNKTDVANFVYNGSAWTLNGNAVTVSNYLNLAIPQITGTLTEQNLVYSGFSGTNYVSLGSTTDNFKAVIHTHITDTAGNRSLMCVSGGSWWIGIWNGYLGGHFNSSSQSTYKINDNTMYWYGIDRNGSTITLYLMEDDNTYTIDTLPAFSAWPYNYSHSYSPASVEFKLGYNAGSASEYWRGTLDLRNSYIKDYNDNYIWYGPTYTPLQANDYIKVNYKTPNTTTSTTATNIKRFIIDGFPFTYATNTYTRAYTFVRDAYQCNLINGVLTYNSAYIDKKNCYVKEPLSFFNSPISLTDHYALGTLDLTDTKCYINNQLYWQADKQFTLGETVKLNRGYGLNNSEWTAYNNISQYTGDMTLNAEVVAVNNNGTLTVKPLYYINRSVLVNANENSADIQTANELPTKSIVFSANTDDAIIDLNTYLSSGTTVMSSNDRREVYIENIPGQEIVANICGIRYTINDNNPYIHLYVPILNYKTNTPTTWDYRITENGTELAYKSGVFSTSETGLYLRVQTFKVSVTNVSGCTIVYTINGRSYTTVDGSVQCYGDVTVNYTVSKTGYNSVSGSYTVPLNNLYSNTYITLETLSLV